MDVDFGRCGKQTWLNIKIRQSIIAVIKRKALLYINQLSTKVQKLWQNASLQFQTKGYRWTAQVLFANPPLHKVQPGNVRGKVHPQQVRASTAVKPNTYSQFRDIK